MKYIYDDKTNRELVYNMYQQVFADPEGFARYYFDEVYPMNQVLLAKEDEDLMGMIHLNPYQICICEREIGLHYIVAVATQKEKRRQGIMRQMLTKVLQDMAKQKEPFTYLIPANRAYYEPFDFVFVMDWLEQRIESIGDGTITGNLEPLCDENIEACAAFYQEYMESYDIYTKITKEYLKRQQLEAKSQQGDFLLWKVEGELRGAFLYGQEEDTVYVRMGFAKREDEFLELLKHYFKVKQIHVSGGSLTTGTKIPKIMFRITNIEALAPFLKSKQEVRIIIKIKDSIIEENDGVFSFCISSKGTKIERCEEEPDITMDIGTLTQYIFGRKGSDVFSQLDLLREIYITEEV